MLVANARVKGQDVVFIGLGQKQLDVMAAGRPIIVSEKSHPSLPGGAMVFFTGKDDQALVETLEKKGVIESAQAVAVTESVTLPQRSYPEGRISPDDDGELQFRAAADLKKKLVILDWGKPVSWIALPPADVVKLAKGLIEKAREVDPTVRV